MPPQFQVTLWLEFTISSWAFAGVKTVKLPTMLNLAEVLEAGKNEILVDPAIIPRAVLPIKRMLDFAKQINFPTSGIGNA